MHTQTSPSEILDEPRPHLLQLVLPAKYRQADVGTPSLVRGGAGLGSLHRLKTAFTGKKGVVSSRFAAR